MEKLNEQYFEDTSIKGSKEAKEVAKKNGWKIVYPEANQIQLDFDSEADYQVWARSRNIVEKFLKITKVVETPSKSGKPGHWHVTVDLGLEVSTDERITLQALLGSDRMRELLSWLSARREDSAPTLFYEK